MDVIRPITFQWTADAAATGYLLEIATDVGFGNVVVAETVATVDHTVWSLASGTTYHWRVTPSNGCGPGSTSVAFNLMTEATLFEDGFESGTVSTWSNSVP
jgi:hypothetical protein